MSIRNRLLYNQSRSYADATHQVMVDVFHSGKPADRILSAFFRQNSKYGSKDRRAITELYFSIFRWWGWLKQLRGVSQKLMLKPMKKRRPCQDEGWLSVVLAADLLDSSDFSPLATQWKEALGFTHYLEAWGDLSLREKAERLHDTFDVDYLSWQQLIPPWLTDHVPLSRDQFPALVELLQQRPPMWLRAQGQDVRTVARELQAAGLKATISPHLPNALRLDNPQVNLYSLDSYRDGHFEVQDFASQVIGHVAAPKPGERWWDACAGAGGKSLQLAAAMKGKGTLLATDIRGYKLKDLKKRAKRSFVHNIRTKEWDGTNFPTNHLEFDGVLVDAPCSNSGTWRRNPDARWTTQPSDIRELQQIQQGLLTTVAPAVRKGGALIYATCSLCEDENEAVVAGFLAEHPDFSPVKVTHPVTGEQHQGSCRIWPEQADSDAMFVARFQRK